MLRAKNPLDPLIVGGYLPQGLVFQLDLLQTVRQAGVALPHPAIVPLQALKFPPQLHIGQIQGAQHHDDLSQQGLGLFLTVGLAALQRPGLRQYLLRVGGEVRRQPLHVLHRRGQFLEPPFLPLHLAFFLRLDFLQDGDLLCPLFLLIVQYRQVLVMSALVLPLNPVALHNQGKLLLFRAHPLAPLRVPSGAALKTLGR